MSHLKKRIKYLNSISYPSITKERRKELLLLQHIAKIRFNNINLLNLALTHRSYANENKITGFNNERLEFLGDSALGLVVTEYLFLTQKDSAEGYLASIKSHVVSEDSLAIAARNLTLENYILIGKGEELSGGRANKSILSDTLEAIFGAYYLDAGLPKTSVFIVNCIKPEIDKVLNDEHDKDYKTILQELVQKAFKNYPVYSVTKRSGPEHRQQFWVKVRVETKEYGPASGNTKKEAEKSVAKLAYEDLHENLKEISNSKKRRAPRPRARRKPKPKHQ